MINYSTTLFVEEQEPGKIVQQHEESIHLIDLQKN